MKVDILHSIYLYLFIQNGCETLQFYSSALYLITISAIEKGEIIVWVKMIIEDYHLFHIFILRQPFCSKHPFFIYTSLFQTTTFFRHPKLWDNIFRHPIFSDTPIFGHKLLRYYSFPDTQCFRYPYFQTQNVFSGIIPFQTMCLGAQFY